MRSAGVKVKYDWLPDFVYGGIDGVVTTFAVVAGVRGADLSTAVILILGFANLFADGFSMAVGKFSSDRAKLQNDIKIDPKLPLTIHPLAGAFYTFISFIVIGVVPLLAYILKPVLDLSNDQAFVSTAVGTLIALFVVGYVKGHVASVHKLYAGIETMLIGGIAASLAYFTGFFLEKLV